MNKRNNSKDSQFL